MNCTLNERRTLGARIAAQSLHNRCTIAERSPNELTVRVFIDTSLWIYRLDCREPDKSAFIRNWLRKEAIENDIVISTQVLIEFRSVITGKLKPALSWQDTQAALDALAGFEVVSANAHLILNAHELARAEILS